jgi:hypothetical protein
MFGRFWIPLIWLLVNGYALGSASLRREIVTILVGVLAWLALYFGVAFTLASGIVAIPAQAVAPYLRLLLFGVFFLTLYLVVFRQSTSYQLFKYSREKSA